MKKPNLKGVIQPQDVYKKGKYSYVSWARTSEYLNELAPGWDFHLETPPTFEQTGVVWVAPDSTGYLMGYFTDPDGKKGAVYPYSIMDMRNNPMKLEKISARDITDSHRRGFCFCAAKEFNLGSELWTGNEIVKSKETEPAKRGGAEPRQNIAVLARDAIVKSTTDEELASHSETLRERFSEGKITQEQYNKLIDLIKARSKALSA
tara:strand:+ start:30533 stop:31150 length:618 start_codon:yes stop_codon:yes gene_type:complete